MPVWHDATRELRRTGQVVMLGVIQEQHAERCRLFAQWKQLNWPIVQDPMNQLGLRGVPIVVALDANGVVEHVNPDRESYLQTFGDAGQTIVAQGDAQPAAEKSVATKSGPVRSKRPSVDALRRAAEANPSLAAWRDLGDAILLWKQPESVTEAIAAYEMAAREERSPELLFRLGVAHRMRYDSASGRPGVGPTPDTNDFQRAVEYWHAALQADPNQYIFRRRIQQYGARLDKPYPFYDWVPSARREIQARHEQPVPLTVEPSGAEYASPQREFTMADDQLQEPDPAGRILRDEASLIRARVTVVPPRVQPGETARVHLVLEPSATAHWNNENEPVVIWLKVPAGWQVSQRRLVGELPAAAESDEPRTFEFETKVPLDPQGPSHLEAYALYYVCEAAQGTCLYLRQDLVIPIHVRSQSP